MRALAFLLAAIVALCAAPRVASALSQSKHRDLSVSACWKHGLPSEFCEAVGTAAYNVDHHEWGTLAAHAQQEEGQSKCQAVSSTLGRIRSLAQELRAVSAASAEYDPKLAVALGRLLHTLQDNCAHSGMPNPQHAWLSLSDSCSDSEVSPDAQPEAFACAAGETALAFEAFASVIVVPQPPVDPDHVGGPSPYPQYWPSRSDVCGFLVSAPTWDGVDRRWNNEIVVPLLREQLYTSLVVDPALPASNPCASGDAALEPVSEPAASDTSHPPEWCTRLDLYCAGKTDSVDEAPPWESDAAPSSQDGSSGGKGCSLSPGAGSARGSALAILIAGMALLVRRRRVS